MRLGKLAVLLGTLGLAVACGNDAVSIDVSPKKAKIYGLERSQRISARLLDKKGQVLEVGPITWTSARPDLVTVDTSGRLVAKKEGSTSVAVKYKKLTVQ